MENENILFSIIIPTRNRPVEFKAALDSVLAQTYKNVEVIVVNDGSNQNFRGEYDALELEYPAVKFLNLIERTRGHGHCFARNQGVEEAKGDFIGFLDDDDYWSDPDFLSVASSAIKKSNSDFYIANQQAITHEGEKINNVWVENLREKLDKNDPRLSNEIFEVSISELFKASGFPHQNVCLISRDLYLSVGGMDENLRYEPDRDIYLRVIDKSSTILYDSRVVAIHNVPDKSKSTNASTKTNRLEKLLFQLRTAEKSILFAENSEVITFNKIRKGYILKHICEELIKSGKRDLAYFYAKEALSISFTLKWMMFTVLCWFRKGRAK